MADFTREELADLRARFKAVESGENFELSYQAALTLLSMAERAVSQDTVLELSRVIAAREEWRASRLSATHEQDGLEMDSATASFRLFAERDLRPAAARLAAKGGRMNAAWLIEGRWISGTEREWGVILDRGPYPQREEARQVARFLSSQSGGGHLYRAVRYTRATPKKRQAGRKGKG